jgi:hypothetical protein
MNGLDSFERIKDFVEIKIVLSVRCPPYSLEKFC